MYSRPESNYSSTISNLRTSQNGVRRASPNAHRRWGFRHQVLIRRSRRVLAARVAGRKPLYRLSQHRDAQFSAASASNSVVLLLPRHNRRRADLTSIDDVNWRCAYAHLVLFGILFSAILDCVICGLMFVVVCGQRLRSLLRNLPICSSCLRAEPGALRSDAANPPYQQASPAVSVHPDFSNRFRE